MVMMMMMMIDEIYWGNTLQFICTFLSLRKMNELLHGKSNKMTCAPSEDSDKPGHLLSLISHHCPHDETLPTERTTKTLVRLDGCPG